MARLSSIMDNTLNFFSGTYSQENSDMASFNLARFNQLV